MLSTDEMTGVQALERKEPTLPLRPGKAERREFEYIRHGTRTFILNRDVVSGQIIAPWDGPTRTEEDFVAHVQHTIATDPDAARWHFVVDNLDIHRSESLVCWVATQSGLDIELGVKYKSGILKSRATRAAVLRADGMKQAAVLEAEGEKQAAILTAEGKRQAVILEAEGDGTALVTVQTAQAEAIEVVFGALTASKVTPEILKYLYIQTLPKMAEGTANKLFVVPSELENIAALGATFSAAAQNGHPALPIDR